MKYCLDLIGRQPICECVNEPGQQRDVRARQELFDLRRELEGGAFILAAGSAATLRTAASPLPQRPSLSVSHQTDQVAVSRAKQSSGQTIFRFDTCGDEQLWTNVLRMHEAIPSVNPVTALAVGLKVGAADLLAVVNHCDALFGLNLSAQQKADLVEFLKSL